MLKIHNIFWLIFKFHGLGGKVCALPLAIVVWINIKFVCTNEKSPKWNAQWRTRANNLIRPKQFRSLEAFVLDDVFKIILIKKYAWNTLKVTEQLFLVCAFVFLFLFSLHSFHSFIFGIFVARFSHCWDVIGVSFPLAAQLSFRKLS